jgi:hypothetical protein
MLGNNNLGNSPQLNMSADKDFGGGGHAKRYNTNQSSFL